MKNLSRIFALLFAFAMVSCGSLAENSADLGGDTFSAPAAYSSGLPAIELLNAKINVGSSSPSTVYPVKLAGDIELENIAYSKSVKVVYSVDGGEWKEADAYYVKSLGNNREHWSFSFTAAEIVQYGDPRAGYSGPNVTVQFALKYVVDGQEYWDNNGGMGVDYCLTTYEGYGERDYAPVAFGKQNIVLRYATYSDYPYTSFRGYLLVKKIDGEVGEVNVVYTTDGWNTVGVLSGLYLYMVADYDDSQMFYFHGGYFGDVDIEFALSQDINGETYWDNNVNENYHVGIGYTAPY